MIDNLLVSHLIKIKAHNFYDLQKIQLHTFTVKHYIMFPHIRTTSN